MTLGYNTKGEVVSVVAEDSNGVERQLKDGISTKDLVGLVGNKYGVDINKLEPEQQKELMTKMDVLSNQINTSIESIDNAATNDFNNALQNATVAFTYDEDDFIPPKPYVPNDIQVVDNFKWADDRPVGGSGDSITGVGSSEDHKYDIPNSTQEIHQQMQQAAIEQGVQEKAEQESGIISVMQKLQQQKNDWIQSLGGAIDDANPDNNTGS